MYLVLYFKMAASKPKFLIGLNFNMALNEDLEIKCKMVALCKFCDEFRYGGFMYSNF
jgi:hypothetical protein